MENLFESSGRLEIVYSRGWISAWEASRLKAGDVVVGETEAGASAELLFEGASLARGDVCVLNDGPGPSLFAFRVEGLEKEAREGPERERAEGLTELLPFELVIGCAAYSLAELSAVSSGSILSLDSPVDAPCPVILRIAGKLAATGRAAVVGESLSMRLDEVAPTGNIEVEPLPTGALILAEDLAARDNASHADRVKIYDFRRPDRFTMRVIKALQSIHTRMAESFIAKHAGLADLKVTVVDQMTWGEFLGSLDKPWPGWEGGATKDGMRFWRTTMAKPGRPYEKEALPSRARASFLQPAAARHPLTEDFGAFLDHWTEEEKTWLGERTCFIAASGALAAKEGEDYIAAMRAGWKLVGDSGFMASQEIKALPVMKWGDDKGNWKPEGDPLGLLHDEMIALVTLETKDALLCVVYAARALYPVMKALDRYARFSNHA